MGNTNLFDYITWRGDITMEQFAFGRIDGMIMSRFAYEPFDIVFGDTDSKVNNQGIKLKDACEIMLKNKNIASMVLYEEDIMLMEALKESNRYKDLIISNFVNIIDTVEETQFSCFTISLEKEASAIIFRGTDNTIIGWKEDLNMGFVNPIAAQRHALTYLQENAPKIGGRLILAGHSKGGNIASYAAAFCGKDIQEQIIAVLNYDGPGFMKEVLATKEFKAVSGKIHTYVPQGSIVGMLLGHREEHRIIHSNEVGPMQHNLYSWEVVGNEFIEESTISKGSINFDSTLKEWISHMDKKQREQFVEGIYSIVSETDAFTLSDLKDNWYENSKIAMQTMKNMDEDTRKIVSDGIKLFVKCATNRLVKSGTAGIAQGDHSTKLC